MLSPPIRYGTAFGGHQLPDDAMEWVQRPDIHARELTQSMNAAPHKGSVHDGNKRNERKRHGEDTVTVDRTEEEADRTTVTKFKGDLHMQSTKAVFTTDLI